MKWGEQRLDTCVSVCVRAYVNVCVYLCRGESIVRMMDVCACVSVCVCASVCAHVYLCGGKSVVCVMACQCMIVCLHLCVCVFIIRMNR